MSGDDSKKKVKRKSRSRTRSQSNSRSRSNSQTRSNALTLGKPLKADGKTGMSSNVQKSNQIVDSKDKSLKPKKKVRSRSTSRSRSRSRSGRRKKTVEEDDSFNTAKSDTSRVSFEPKSKQGENIEDYFLVEKKDIMSDNNFY